MGLGIRSEPEVWDRRSQGGWRRRAAIRRGGHFSYVLSRVPQLEAEASRIRKVVQCPPDHSEGIHDAALDRDKEAEIPRSTPSRGKFKSREHEGHLLMRGRLGRAILQLG